MTPPHAAPRPRLPLLPALRRFSAPERKAMAVEGQISRAEVRQLMALARQVTAGAVIIEIGSYRGRSSVALALGSICGNRNRIYAIDPHTEFQGARGGRFGPTDQAAFYRNLVKAGVGEIVAVVSLPSAQVASNWPERNVGLLWLDGDHRYEAVREDYRAWSPLVREDGVIAFHDIDEPGVAQLLAEVTGEAALRPLGQTGALAWYQPQQGAHA